MRAVNDAGRDRVDIDAVFDQCEARRLGETDHGGLGRTVDRNEWLTASAGLARHVNDLAAAALPDHQFRDRLQREECPGDINRKQCLEAFAL